MLHSDQSREALRGAHLGMGGKCSQCQRPFGWWQGVVQDGKKGAQWTCAVCAVLFETTMPPPAGFIRWWIHPLVWEHLGLPQYSNRVERLEQTIRAIPLAIAWGLEAKIFDAQALKKNTFQLPGTPVEDKKHFPVIVRRPGWWQASELPALPLYVGSSEERTITSTIRGVLEVPPDAEWVRADYTYPEDWEWADPWPGVAKWFTRLPDTHPAVNQGAEKIIMVPRQAITDQTTMSGFTFQQGDMNRLDAALTAIIQSRCASSDDPRPASIWQQLGWTR